MPLDDRTYTELKTDPLLTRFHKDYDATAHISEEVKRAAYAAPVAIFVAGDSLHTGSV